MNLYISDLDGTLLNNKAIISNNSKTILNSLIKDKKINFSIATARTPATVVPILSDINISIPVVVMNGAAIYDIKNNKYLTYNKIPRSIVSKIQSILSKHNISAFSYTIKENHINAYYEKINSILQQKFIESRSGSPFKSFINSPLPKNSDVLYFFLMDKKEIIKDVYDKIKHIHGLYSVIYEDVYNSNIYNLEIYSEKSSKANSIKFLMDKYNFDKLICFGDNLNDIPMFQISDECYAVNNACPELKSISTSIIDSNINDGVAKFLNNL